MTTTKKILIAALVPMLWFPLLTQAQGSVSTSTPPKTKQPKLIADVDIVSLTKATTTDGVSGIFGISSKSGSQEVVYGFSVQDNETGQIFDTTKEGELSLPEGNVIYKAFKYTFPTYIRHSAVLYLSVYNKQGILLANAKVADVPKGTSTPVCTVKEDMFSCVAASAGSLQVDVTSGSPQGEKVFSNSVELPAKKTVTTSFKDLTKDLPAGRYFISGTVFQNGKIADKAVGAFYKEGVFAKIMSVMAVERKTEDRQKEVVATVFINMSGISSASKVALTASAPDCGESVVVAVSSLTTEMHIPVTCTSGKLTVTLSVDDRVMDTATSDFVLPVDKNSNMKNIGYVLLLLLVLAAMYPLLKKRMSATPNPVAVAVLVAVITLISSTSATHALTYAAEGEDIVTFCNAGDGCTDLQSNYPVSGTITVPSEVAPGSDYPVTVALSNPNTGGGSSGTSLWCRDNASDDVNCDSQDVYGELWRNGTYVGATGYHPPVNGQTVTFTAGTSGEESLAFNFSVRAPFYTGCNTGYTSTPIKCLWQIDPTQQVITIPIATKYCEVTDSLYNSGSLSDTAYSYLLVGQTTTLPYSGNLNAGTAHQSTCKGYGGASCPGVFNGPPTTQVTYTCNGTTNPTPTPSVNLYFTFLDKVKDMFTAFAAGN